LRDSDPDPKESPTRKLLKFFAGKYDNDEMERKGLVFVTEKTEGRVRLRGVGLKGLNLGWVRRWLRNGDSLGRLSPNVFLNLYKLLKRSLYFKV
jgi:hypothetical protein